MVQQQADRLRREVEALEGENELLWAQVRRGGIGLEGCHPPRGVDAGAVEVLQREQDALMAGLRLGEELLKLRNENDSLVAQTQELYEDNAGLRRENEELHGRYVAAERTAGRPTERVPERAEAALPTRSSSAGRLSGRRQKEPPPAPARPAGDGAPSPGGPQSARKGLRRSASQPRSEPKPFVQMREERRDMVAAQLKAGLLADANSRHEAFPGAWTDAPSPGPPRGAPIVPKPFAPAAGARSSFGEESSFNREMAVRDMLRGLAANQ